MGGNNLMEGARISRQKSMILLPPGNSIMGAIISRYTGPHKKLRSWVSVWAGQWGHSEWFCVICGTLCGHLMFFSERFLSPYDKQWPPRCLWFHHSFKNGTICAFIVRTIEKRKGGLINVILPKLCFIWPTDVCHAKFTIYIINDEVYPQESVRQQNLIFLLL